MNDPKTTYRNRRPQYTTDNIEADIKKLGELIKDIRIAMLTTVNEDGTLRSRPMATQQMEFDGDLWFFTGNQTSKVEDITHFQQVNLAYAAPGDERYVSVMGKAEMVNDTAKMKELWNPIFKAWFPEGLNDPNLRLIRVSVEEAEYWESPGGKVGSLLGIVKDLVTGKTGAEGKNETIQLQ